VSRPIPGRPSASRGLLALATAPFAVAVVTMGLFGWLGSQAAVPRPALLAVYVTCVTVCTAWWLLRAIRPPARRPDTMAALGRRGVDADPHPPQRLLAWERMVTVGMSSALDADQRLRPQLRELACALLRVRRGLVVDPAGDDVATRCGAPGEPLLGARRPRRPELTERGPSAEDVRRVIRVIEMI